MSPLGPSGPRRGGSGLNSGCPDWDSGILLDFRVSGLVFGDLDWVSGVLDWVSGVWIDCRRLGLGFWMLGLTVGCLDWGFGDLD